MTCRCASAAEHSAREADQYRSDLDYKRKRIAELEAELAVAKAVNTPDNTRYQVVDVEPVGPHLVLRVRYPSCKDCAFEGDKVMVMLDCRVVDALKWREIDPHFRLPVDDPMVAPPPAARFPATPDGWCDAMTYARGKVVQVVQTDQTA